MKKNFRNTYNENDFDIDRERDTYKNTDTEDKRRKRIILYIIIIIILLLLISSCSCTSKFFGKIGGFFKGEGSYTIDGSSDSKEVIKNKELQFDTESTEMSLSDSKTRISFSYRNINPDGFTCKTSDAEIATCYVMNNYVVIMPKKAGEITVYLQTNANGKTYEATTKVIINDLERSILLDSTEGTINLRQENSKNIVYRFVELSGELSVTSSDESIAIATAQDGILKITGLKVGTATITLSLTYNDRIYKSIYTIHVINEKINTTTPNKPSKPSGEQTGSEKNGDSTLRSLTTNKGTLVFNPNTYTYYVGVNSWTSKVTLNAQPNNPKATISYTYNGVTVNSLDKLKLNTGDNTVTITVTAENGNKSIYTVVINKAKSSQNYLKSLTTSKGELNPAFDKNKLLYDIDVENDVTTLDLTAIPKSKKATITYTYNGQTGIPDLKNLNLKEGLNTVTITVTAEDGTARDYIVRINRKPTPGMLDKNSALDDLLMEPTGRLDFDPAKKEYYVGVSYEEKVTLIGKPASDKATITYIYNGTKYTDFNDRDLPVGDNTVKVIVKAQDGSTTEYTVHINKSPLNKETSLLNLTTNKGKLEPNFESNTLEYTIVLENKETDVTLTATASEKATISYTYKGTSYTDFKTMYLDNLEIGENKVIIAVTDEEGNKREYIVNIIRKPDASLSTDSTITLEVKKDDQGEIQDLLAIGNYKYTITVGENINSLTFFAKLNDQKAKEMTYVYTSNNVEISKGKVENNQITVSPIAFGNGNTLKVTGLAENGYTKTTYEITIIKTNAQGSANNLLKDLQALLGSENKITAYDKEKNIYNVEVGSNDTSITILGIPEDEKANIIYKINGETISSKDGHVVALKPGNNQIKVQVIAENGSPSEVEYTVNVYRPFTTDITVNNEVNHKVHVKVEYTPFPIGYTITTKDKDGNLSTDEYDVNGVEVKLNCPVENNICDLVTIEKIEKDVITLVPKDGVDITTLIGKTVGLTISYGEQTKNTTVEFGIENKNKLETANNIYQVTLNRNTPWNLVLNTDLFDVNTNANEKIEAKPIENGIRLYMIKNGVENPYVYVDITTTNHDLIKFLTEQSDFTSPSSLTIPIETLEAGTASIEVKGYYYGKQIINNNFPVILEITRKYKVTIDAGEHGVFAKDSTTGDNIVIYTFELEKGQTVSLEKYHPYYDDGNCIYYDLLEYKERTSGVVYQKTDIITVDDKDIYLEAVYDMDHPIDAEVPITGKYYLKGLELSSSGKMSDQGIIYPGASGVYEATVTNKLEDDITVVGMTFEEETICIDNMGCLNMGYIIKRETDTDSIYYYGSVDKTTRTYEERYTILNRDAASINDPDNENYRSIKDNYTIRKIEFKNDAEKQFTLKKGESIKLIIKWEWPFEGLDDKLDTEIGNYANNHIDELYRVLIGLDYEIANKCTKE